MDETGLVILPLMLMLARVSAFMAVLPLFSWSSLPVTIRAGLTLLMTVFFAFTTPQPELVAEHAHWLGATMLIVREVLCGLALGLALRLIFSAVQQGGMIIEQQMGLADSEIIDPTSGDSSQLMGIFMEMSFALLLFSSGAHHLLLMVIYRSYEIFPLAAAPDPAVFADGIVHAGSAMLIFMLKLAAPLLAAFLMLSAVLAVVSRIMPEMNILFASFPLRVGLGMFMAAAIMPSLEAFTGELASWVNHFVIS